MLLLNWVETSTVLFFYALPAIDMNLIKNFFQERSQILEHASQVDGATFLRRDHHVPLLIRLISRFIRNYF